eukprot:CAMPEP_0184392644 /NCGR_PEP_ID=MMETSP0007-20130409/29233_1 /TAXON_ID=97485 /ORGANISM="Prymnesium parvum, Strain Texoma1" /LENGTH=128 /DNA_ID=CAMNT_0026743301 /DNA_START=435 /DNA_END=818 /DNA_ORIENTATION=+
MAGSGNGFCRAYRDRGGAWHSGSEPMTRLDEESFSGLPSKMVRICVPAFCLTSVLFILGFVSRQMDSREAKASGSHTCFTSTRGLGSRACRSSFMITSFSSPPTLGLVQSAVANIARPRATPSAPSSP